MKLFITLCTVLIAFFGLTQARKILPDDVHAEIKSYGRQRSAGVRMQRGNRNLMQCYDVYIPEISRLAESGKTESQACIANAETTKDQRLQQVQDKRAALNESLQSVREILRSCSEQLDTIEYLKCLTDSAEQYQSIIHAISDTAENIFDQLDDAFSKIETKEHSCINSVIEQAKQNTDNVFETLQSCLISGYQKPLLDPEPQPVTVQQTDKEPEQQPDEEAAKQPETTPSQEPNSNPVQIPEQQPVTDEGQEPETSEQLPEVETGHPPEQIGDTEPVQQPALKPGELPEQEPNLEPGLEIDPSLSEPGQPLESESGEDLEQKPETETKPDEESDQQTNTDKLTSDDQIPEEDLD